MVWTVADRADPLAIRIFDRHYTRRPSSLGQQVAAPGRVLVLVSDDGKALWITREQDPVACKHAWPGSWECAAFRNEGAGLSSRLVTEAVAATRALWGEPPPRGFLTFVNPTKVRSTNPGFCFLKAGWSRESVRTKKAALVVLTLSPDRFPLPAAPLGAQCRLFTLGGVA